VLSLALGCNCGCCCGSAGGGGEVCADHTFDATTEALDLYGDGTFQPILPINDGFTPADPTWPTFATTFTTPAPFTSQPYHGQITESGTFPPANPYQDVTTPAIGRTFNVLSGMVAATAPDCCQLSDGLHLTAHYYGLGAFGFGTPPGGVLLWLVLNDHQFVGSPPNTAYTYVVYAPNLTTVLANGAIPAGGPIPVTEGFVFPDGSGIITLNDVEIFAGPPGFISDPATAWLGLVSPGTGSYRTRLQDITITCAQPPPGVDARVTDQGDARVTSDGDFRVVT